MQLNSSRMPEQLLGRPVGKALKLEYCVQVFLGYLLHKYENDCKYLLRPISESPSNYVIALGHMIVVSISEFLKH